MLMARSPSQKDPFMVIDESERPYVVAYGGRSPSKSPAARNKAGREFAKAAGIQPGAAPYMTALTTSSPRGSLGGNITPRSKFQQIGEQRWDNRHHMTPSLYNTVNHTFYKVSLALILWNNLKSVSNIPDF